MEKIVALVLAMLLALGMVGALADASITNDDGTVTLTMKYSAPNGGTSPAETFGFTALSKVENGISENPAATYPASLPTITDIVYTEGKATEDGTGTGTATATISLPDFTAVGVYKYKFNTVTPTTTKAGVTYPDANTDRYLVVTVINGDDGVLRVAAVHCEGSANTGSYGASPKTDELEAIYNVGTLTVKKTVTGNLGDKTKEFNVTVSFTIPNGTQLGTPIAYVGNEVSKYRTSTNVANNTVTLQIKNGDEVTFSNIPAGVTYTVVEDEKYTLAENGGYAAAVYDNSDEASKENESERITNTGHGTIAAGDADTVGITNNKTTTIDTGITLDTLPYVLLLAAAVVGAVLLVARKRRQDEE